LDISTRSYGRFNRRCTAGENGKRMYNLHSARYNSMKPGQIVLNTSFSPFLSFLSFGLDDFGELKEGFSPSNTR